jgi:alpha/beta superfamily hydrolase
MGVFIRLLADLRAHDLMAALAWMNKMHPERHLLVRFSRFFAWVFNTMWRSIPDALAYAAIEEPVSRTPVWLIEGNPHANYPWKENQLWLCQSRSRSQ